MATHLNGLPYIKELSDSVKLDYIWYRACVITGNIRYSNPRRDELQIQLLQMSQHEQANEYMRNSCQHDTIPLGTERFIKILISEFEQCCLKLDDFYWIKDNDERMICYLWKLLDRFSCQLSGSQVTNWELYEFIEGNNFKINTNMASVIAPDKASIICCINRINMDINHKTKLLKNIKSKAELSLKHKEVTGWLKTDTKEKLSWLPKYINAISRDSIKYVTPESSSIEMDIIIYFDILCTFNDDKFKLMIINMKKAWNQRKYREKNKDKKQYSLNMSNDIASMLDVISSEKNINKNELVESLIRTEHEKVTGIKHSHPEGITWSEVEERLKLAARSCMHN